jgi:tetratricopeptide (TPR) repeat protein
VNTRTIMRLLVACLFVLVAETNLSADPLDNRFLDGLRQRRLFELAEAHCTNRLSRLPPLEPAQADLTVELIRTLALHAVHSAPPDRDPLWSKAHAAAASFLRQSSLHPRAGLVRFQDALSHLARGELGRQELEAGILRGDQLEAIQQVLRQAAGHLESLTKELKGEIPLRRRTAPRPGELTADELTRLDEHVQHQLARANKNRALLFDRGSDDRVSLLLAAIDGLQRLLPQVPPAESLSTEAQLDLAECQRLLGRYEQAAELATALDQAEFPAQTRLWARAELIRVALGQSDLAAARRVMDQGRVMGDARSPELDFAWLEALLAFARTAAEGKRVLADDRTPPAELARKYQQQAADSAKFLEQTYGPHWGQRASQLLTTALPRGAVASVELLSRAADSLYLKGDFDRAIATYDDAVGQARGKSDFQSAFELAYKAALVEQQRGHHMPAANRLRILAKNMPTHPQAPQAHLLAAWNTAQQSRADPTATNDYDELLAEHLSLWPAAESADQARMWLGKYRETKADWRGAIAAYSTVSRASPHYASAISALARPWREELATPAAAGQPTADAAGQAILFFRQAVTGPENRWPERWTEADRTAALAAAQLIVNHQPGRSSDAEELLRRAIAGSFDAPATWTTAAQAQLVIALAAQGNRRDEALAELRSIGAASAEQMLAVLNGLSQVVSRSSERARPQIANVQLAAVAALAKDRTQLSPDQQLALDRIHAEALAGIGRRDEALEAYERLAKSNPQSGAIQEGYARLLLASSDSSQIKQALDQWRMVASRTKPRTTRWFEAKYSVALAQYKLGDKAGAATLLRFILETPPGLQGTEWETSYRDLLRKCNE